MAFLAGRNPGTWGKDTGKYWACPRNLRKHILRAPPLGTGPRGGPEEATFSIPRLTGTWLFMVSGPGKRDRAARLGLWSDKRDSRSKDPGSV